MKRILLNVGTEKAGTTWLYSYFQVHPEYKDIGVKELNVLQTSNLVPTLSSLSKILQADLELYLDYFDAQYDGRVLGDFTHYEMSTPNVFKLLKDGFESRGFQVFPVYIMREPTDRAWSAYKMINADSTAVQTNNAFAYEFLMRHFLRPKYKETVEALDLVFGDSVQYYFYETFFNDEKYIYNLCDTLGIDRKTPELSRKVNTTRESEISSVIVNYLSSDIKTQECIEFIRNRFKDVPWEIN